MLRGAGGPAEAHKRLLAYLDWANVAVQTLAKQISDADLHVLVLTMRYEQLLSGVGIMWGTAREFQRAVIDLVDLEVNQRVEALESAIKELEAHKEAGPTSAICSCWIRTSTWSTRTRYKTLTWPE